MTFPYSKPSGSFGNESLLSGLMQYGPATPPQMSMAPAEAGNPALATYSPLSFTGDNGQVTSLGGMGQMNFGMSPIPADVAGGMAGPEGAGGMFGDFFSRDNLMGKINADGSKTMGVLPVGLGALQGLGSLFMGMQQYGLAKKQLAEGKRRYDQDYNAQKALTNGRMEDRQRARVASNPGAYESVGNYMNKNGIK